MNYDHAGRNKLKPLLFSNNFDTFISINGLYLCLLQTFFAHREHCSVLFPLLSYLNVKLSSKLLMNVKKQADQLAS